MHHSTRRRRQPPSSRRSWCCSFVTPPSSPDTLSSHKHNNNKSDNSGTKLSANSVPNSPPKPGWINPRRILSPGRVSPIEHHHHRDDPVTENPSGNVGSKTPSFRGLRNQVSGSGFRESGNGGEVFDVRLNLRGKNRSGIALELSSEVLCANSEVFKGLVDSSRNGNGKEEGLGESELRRVCTLEVGDIENLGVFKETIEMMFDEDHDITRRLMRIGVYRAIDVLEVSANIAFNRGVLSCLKYLEAVPWTEEEEEKLRSLLTKFKFDDTTAREILARLYVTHPVDSQENLARQLVTSITSCADANARNELKLLVKGLLCKSSVYEKGCSDISKDDLYAVCLSCLDSLIGLFEEASKGITHEKSEKKETNKPLVERISRQVDNMNWLLEILLDRQVAEEFVDLWANQGKLLKMHENTSPMVRYELSRVSANLFVAIGNRKLHCYSEGRSALLQAWFGPMLSDFGWLQRCRKGLDMKALEEALGQTLLTLPLKQQHALFMEWFRCFSKHGTECPNLSKAFQIWWRRTSSRGTDTYAVEFR